MSLLAIGDVWHLPSMWHDARSYYHNDDGDTADPRTRGLVARGSSDVRCREKIRFSAVANAIRFLETRLSPMQRLDIRKLVLHEDLPSVNEPSAHAEGLAPFFRENSRLRVERRVDMMGCMFPALAAPSHVAARFQSPDDCPGEAELCPTSLRVRISRWLLGALATTLVGIPAEAFTLILEAGPYKDYFADQFQQRVHKDVAWYWANKKLEEGNDIAPAYHRAIRDVLLKEEELEAIENLVNGTSPILRCDFNTGIALDPDIIVNATRHLAGTFDWVLAWGAGVPQRIEQPKHQADYNTRLADNFEIRMD